MYEQILKKLQNIKTQVIIGTDQNFDYMKIDQNKNTQELLNLFFNNCIFPTIIKPTRITHSSAPLIDNLYININNDTNIKSGIILSDISDHLPIFACIGKQKEQKRLPIKIKTRPLSEEILKNIKIH